MHTKIIKNIFLTTLLALSLIIFNGCLKKAIEPHSSSQEGSNFSGGTDIQYPPADSTGYSETSIGKEETLDDTAGLTSSEIGGNLSLNMGQAATSDDFKKEHGRSSMGLSPIYFDFDQATIKPEMADRMKNNALFLKQTPGAKVIVEGNCDDRGTKEYNLALGERRALIAKQYLIDLGIEPYRIRTVGYGEEQPLFPGQDDFSYAQNRRDDFILE